jgi:hypothetical protein
MAVTQLNKLDIVSKRLDGRTHTSPVLATPSENISSTVQLGGQSIFADQLPTDSQIPTTAPTIYTRYSQSLGGKTVLEYVRFQLTAVGSGNYPYTAPATDILISSSIEQIGETTVSSTNHTYALRLTGSYESNSSNPKKGTAPYVNNYHLTGSGFGLQIVPPAFGVNYTPRLYSGSTEIPFSDPSDWVVDCSAGILWIQDPTQFAAGASTIPTHVDAYLYIGDYAAATIAALSASIQSVAGTNAYATMSVGGVAVIADTATGNLSIASGSFAGSANTNNNLLISGSAGNDTITFSFKDSPTFTNLATSTLTASATPEIPSASLSNYHIALVGSNGQLVKVATLPSGNIAGVNSFSNITIGGVTVTADSSADTLTINSGSFAGSANTNNNLLISASQDDVITFSFNDSPTFTQITASGNILGSGNLSITGTSTLTGRLTANGAITTTNITASGNISSSAGLIGATLTTSGNGTIGGTLAVTSNATVGGNLTVTGDLTVNGDTTVINTSNISIEDKFIVLGRSSGSLAPLSEGGIIVEGANGSGSAFVFNSGSGGANGLANRWGVALGVPTGSMNVTPTDYMVTVSASAAAPSDSNAPTFGSASFGFGNMHIQESTGDIWIYS